MHNGDEIEEIRNLVQRLQKMLEEHRGMSHVVGLMTVIHELSNDDVIPDERIRCARSIFRNMMGGMGTLGDFVIWDESEPRRVSLNHELSELLAELWDRLEC